jgi:urease beta subunit
MGTHRAYPGQITYAREPVVINRNRRAVKLIVKNTGDRPVQVGSHFHFFEVNRALEFDRAKAFGTHLDIQAGLSVRFEPGDERAISLVEFGGNRNLWGFNDLTRGRIRSESVRRRALKTARKLGFRGA